MTTVRASREVRIVAHGNNLLAIFPKATERDPGTLCRKLRRLESKAYAIGLRLCNGPEYPNEDDADTACEAILGKVYKLLGNAGSAEKPAIPIFINRDPRGYALKIRDVWMREHSAKLETDWCGYGLIAPEIK